TLVIGGLIGERKSKTRSGIPYLMDIPVVGRFFGTTSDETRRTELIMLITPHVIRNQNESRHVTDEFKSKVESVRNELERIERERAKSQPKPPPPEIPAPVEPKASEEKPPFAPSRFVPQRGASATPDHAQVTVLSNVGAVRGTPEPRSVMVEASAPSPGDPLPADASVAGETIPAAPATSPPPSPAYLLSLGRHQAAAPDPVTRPSSERPNERKPARQWAVQVAALADRKDADAMVVGLRKDGYEAYVMTVQSETKTWHRVRVGQFSDVAPAKQLRQSLVNNLQFKGAYIAAN
ncbi:MAG: SPOR domain-containing protein, partial [Candidatus Binatia bacterium]